MNYVLDHWSVDPFLIIAIVLAIWHEVGLARLASGHGPDLSVPDLAGPDISGPDQPGTDWTSRRRRRSLLFYAGLVVMLLAVQSPIQYWSRDYFFVHMIQHLLLMFAAPSLIVAAAPWQPLVAALPKRAGPVMTAAWSRPLRATGGLLARPWVSVALFSVVMVIWHLPGPLDLAERNQAVQIWLMHTSFLIAGVLFWLQFIPSPPFRIRITAMFQALALLATNCVMWVLAMAMGFLTSGSWYSVYNHIPGVTLPAFADQQIGAGILWICGDFWAIPTMVFVIKKLLAEDGGVSTAVDRMLGRGSARFNWANRG